ncbi:MAG: prepilin peptidase [Actinomycetales bacterium]|nr:prepilin peptidase [Actinomycetales bacterium]
MAGRQRRLSAAAVGAVLFATAAPSAWHAVAGAGVGAAAGWLAMTDAETHHLPDRVVLPALGMLLLSIAGASWVAGDTSGIAHAGAGAVCTATGLLALALISRGGLGFGDVKFGVLLGTWAGWIAPGAPVIMMATAALLGGLAALLLRARGTPLSTRIPFGPMLAAGAAAATWWPGS